MLCVVGLTVMDRTQQLSNLAYFGCAAWCHSAASIHIFQQQAQQTNHLHVNKTVNAT